MIDADILTVIFDGIISMWEYMDGIELLNFKGYHISLLSGFISMSVLATILKYFGFHSRDDD